MKILVIGNGGREHALVWKIAQSPLVDVVFAVPGNAGTAGEPKTENVRLDTSDFGALIRFCRDVQVDLTVVGPEAPLAAGIVDAFSEAGLKIFGPTASAAELEASKVFCKDLLRRADVPTADYQVFDDADSATRFVLDRYDESDKDVALVVKADGLAAGKGVIVCRRRREVLEAIDLLARQGAYGGAGKRLVIEERLDGEEASVLAVTDGRTIVTLPPCQDHKPAYDGDRGPNTGGMGAYCPAPLVDETMLRHIEERVLVPTVHTMKRLRRPMRGLLYAGLMITSQGPKVLEYNVRFGDPECQPLLMRLQSDLVELLLATVEGGLGEIAPPVWDPRPAVCVVMASEGYPGEYETGHPIRGLEEASRVEGVKVFHAGTRREGDQIVTAGGRVLGVTALGETISTAKLQAYKAVKCIRWQGAWCRKDISDKALSRE